MTKKAVSTTSEKTKPWWKEPTVIAAIIGAISIIIVALIGIIPNILPNGDPPDEPEILIQVRDQDNNPISGIMVILQRPINHNHHYREATLTRSI